MCVCVRVCVCVCVCVCVLLVCVVGVIYVYVDTVFGFYGYFFFYCSARCLSMIVSTPAALVSDMHVFLYLHLFSATEHVSHGKAL